NPPRYARLILPLIRAWAPREPTPASTPSGIPAGGGISHHNWMRFEIVEHDDDRPDLLLVCGNGLQLSGISRDEPDDLVPLLLFALFPFGGHLQRGEIPFCGSLRCLEPALKQHHVINSWEARSGFPAK